MSEYEKLIDLAKSYAEIDATSLGDLIFILCDAIKVYDLGFGDMPGKNEDLRNACKWVIRLIENDLQYFRKNIHGDEVVEILNWEIIWGDSFREIKTLLGFTL